MSLSINPNTGTLLDSDSAYGISEYFYNENPPPALRRELPPLTDVFDASLPSITLQPSAAAPAPLANDSAVNPSDASVINSKPAPSEQEQRVTRQTVKRGGATSIDNARSVINPSGF